MKKKYLYKKINTNIKQNLRACYSTVLTIFLIILGIFILSLVIHFFWQVKYGIDETYKSITYNKNLKLIKYKVKNNKVDCCFFDVVTSEKYIIHIRRFLLRKDFIPEELAIESNPRTFYYNYITSKLENEKEYEVTFYESATQKIFLLCLEEKPM